MKTELKMFLQSLSGEITEKGLDALVAYFDLPHEATLRVNATAVSPSGREDQGEVLVTEYDKGYDAGYDAGYKDGIHYDD